MKPFLTTLLLGVLFATLVYAGRQKPLKDSSYPGQSRYICKECVPRELIYAPGVGFDLTSSYATIAVRCQNETIVDVGRLEGGEEYTELIARLGPPFVYTGPPFDNPLDQIRWNLDQASRKWRKLRGLPSTTDISILSEMLHRLKNFATYSLMMPISRVAISLPDLPNLSYGDWLEVIEFSELEVLSSYKNYGDSLHNLNAAWAGMGYGLCKDWRDIEKCEDEEYDMKPRFALALSFTGSELSVHKTYVGNAHFIRDFVSSNHRDLGFDAWKMNTGNTTFWDSLGKAVADVATTYPEYVLQDLILLGEYAEEKMFLDAVWKALGDVTDVKKLWEPLQVSGFNAEFVAARGAAEFAKRWQGETWNCVEADWCEDGGGSDEGKEEI